ncbi:MAG: hypothetical protein J5979_04085 [Lachnospiraceae bacterium]|nr:hypothetical protein [Lachnospiraceae bacterium]
MTEDQRRPPRIPTREEFHREWSGEITLADFSTEHPNPYRLNQQMTAYKFNQYYKNKTNDTKDNI